MFLGKDKAIKEVYLDWASAAPISDRAWKVFVEASKEQGNPSSPHAAGVRAARILEDARTRIARLASVKSENVIFTSGATEANNLALRGHIQALEAAGTPLNQLHVLYLPTAHASVVETIESLAKNGVQTEPLELVDGEINLKRLAEQIRPETVLVAVDVVCGETGTCYKVRDVRRVLDATRKESNAKSIPHSRITLFADASQAAFTESIELTQLGADLLTLDAQKVGGVRGIGALIRANALISLEKIVYGGGQEHDLRPGTEQPALAVAFATALEDAQTNRHNFDERAMTMWPQHTVRLQKSFPDMAINAGKYTVPHILNLSFPGRDMDYAVMLLSKAGYMVSTKSACETNEEGSRIVQIMTGDSGLARSTLRISWGPTTTQKQLDEFFKELERVLTFLDAHALPGGAV